MINKELIERFLRDQCTPEQAREIADHLSGHPELLEQYLSGEEFMAFREVQHLPEAVSAAWLEHIHQESRMGDDIGTAPDVSGPGPVPLWNSHKWLRGMAAAAIAGGLIFGMVWLFQQGDRSGLKNVAPAKAIASIPPDERVRKENTGAAVLPLVLPDGSLVRLMPKATVVYRKKFTENRGIYLEGEAGFEVVSDKAHAFTVYSGELSTTVLGTSFHVKAMAEDEMITVRLNTGKVVVGSPLFSRSPIADVILTPGKELRYNRKSMAVTVISFRAGNVLVKAGNPLYKGIAKPDWYKFSNQPISDVLDQLSNYFNVPIYYYPADIKQIYFEGKFEKADSLEKILTDITLPNNLKFVREDSGIVIKKK
jgi:transmembrane sensor